MTSSSSANNTTTAEKVIKRSKHDRQITAVKKRIDKTSETLRSLNEKLKVLEQFNNKASNEPN